MPPTPLPGTAGSAGAIAGFGGRPARIWVSTNVMFANAASTTTWPGPGTGSGNSAAISTDGGPNSASITAITRHLQFFRSGSLLKTTAEQNAPQMNTLGGMAESTARRRGRHAEGARNDQRLLDAARDVFASQGTAATVAAIAAR